MDIIFASFSEIVNLDRKGKKNRAATRQSEKDTRKEVAEKLQDELMPENVKMTNTAEKADSKLGDKNMMIPDELRNITDFSNSIS